MGASSQHLILNTFLSNTSMKILHIITGLTTGGAEMMLFRMIEQMQPRHESIVISLLGKDEIGEKIEALGVTVHAIGMRRGIPDAKSYRRLEKLVREIKPEVIHTWMYHANLMGGIAARRAGIKSVMWSLHHTNLQKDANKRTTIWTARLCAILSKHIPRKIVSCSEVARRTHIAFGYDAARMVTIPNGYDVSEFLPNPEARVNVREELKVSLDTPLIGIVGRFHPQKDHHNFVRAAGKLHRKMPHVHFLLIGKDIDLQNTELANWIEKEQIGSVVHLLGKRDDIPHLNAALDLATISSAGEGFPNVVGEAMACGVPCVVTDVGDAAYLVGETGFSVPPKDPEALANAWEQMLLLSAEERQQRGEKARERILQNFAIEKVVLQYGKVYEEMLTL